MLLVRLRLFVVVIVSLASAAGLWGQGISTGTIIGTVEDQYGAVVAKATITAVQDGTNVSSTAVPNPAGEFQLRALPVGTYKLTIESAGFAALTITNVVVHAGIPTTIGSQALQVLGTTTSVSVESSTPLLQSDSMQVSQTYDTAKLGGLPIGNGLDFVTLLTPGVAPAGDITFSTNNRSAGAAFATNGQRARDNNFQIDGQNNNDTAVGGPAMLFRNQDALEEIQVFTDYSAEYGRNTGTIINYITKQGTNEFHGSAFEFYNGSWAQSMANQDKSLLFFACPSGTPAGSPTPYTSSCNTPKVPRFVDNRFGGTVGGPIVKNKLWFYGSGNLQRQITGAIPESSSSSLTPDPAGILQLQAAFPNNPAVAVLKAFGPTAAPGTVTFGVPQTAYIGGDGTPAHTGAIPIEVASVTRSLPSTFNDNEASGRVDWQVTDKDRMFSRYVFQQQTRANNALDGSTAAAAGDLIDIRARNQEIGIDFTHTFSNSFINQVRYSYTRTNAGFEGGTFPTCTRANVAACPTSISFNDGVGLGFGEGPSFPQGIFILDHQFQDNASVMHSRHYFKFGGEFDRQSQPSFSLPFINGLYAYNNLSDYIVDNQPGQPGSLPAGWVPPNPATLFLINGSPKIDFHENQIALYFQDDWKALDNLTVTLGMRYELYGQVSNVLHDQTVARESNAATAIWDQTLPLSQRTVPSLPANTRNFAPIIGFAYSPKGISFLGKDQTIIRGGFRISYNPAYYNIFVNVAGTAPAVNFGIASCDNCLPAAGTGGAVLKQNSSLLPVGGNPGNGIEEVLPSKFVNPYSEGWQLGVQQGFGPNVAGELRYVGNHGVHLFQNVNGNPWLIPYLFTGFSSVIPSSITPCTDPTQPGFGFVNCNTTLTYKVTNTGYSNYNGLQARLDFRNWHNLTGGVSYTFSKTIDNTSEIFGTRAGGNTQNFAQNPFDNNERALSGIDYPHDFSAYLLYDLPFLRGRNDLTGKVLGGWEISPLYRHVSGQTYSVVQNHPGSWVPGSLCDPLFLSGIDACRPILENRSAPFNSVGICSNPSLPDCGIMTYDPSNRVNGQGVPTTLQNVHWIYNDLRAADFLHTPFAGAGRNLSRGSGIDAMNLALTKRLKLKERLTLELHFTAYNLLNHQFLGNPDPNVSDGSSFGKNVFNKSGGNQVNTVFLGEDRRSLELGAKIIF